MDAIKVEYVPVDAEHDEQLKLMMEEGPEEIARIEPLMVPVLGEDGNATGYKCTCCNKVFRSKGLVRRHRGRLINCVCGRGYASWQSYQRHKKQCREYLDQINAEIAQYDAYDGELGAYDGELVAPMEVVD